MNYSAQKERSVNLGPSSIVCSHSRVLTMTLCLSIRAVSNFSSAAVRVLSVCPLTLNNVSFRPSHSHAVAPAASFSCHAYLEHQHGLYWNVVGAFQQYHPRRDDTHDVYSGYASLAWYRPAISIVDLSFLLRSLGS